MVVVALVTTRLLGPLQVWMLEVGATVGDTLGACEFATSTAVVTAVLPCDFTHNGCPDSVATNLALTVAVTRPLCSASWVPMQLGRFRLRKAERKSGSFAVMTGHGVRRW